MSATKVSALNCGALKFPYYSANCSMLSQSRCDSQTPPYLSITVHVLSAPIVLGRVGDMLNDR